MKSLLPLALVSLLASCTAPKNAMRPSSEIPDQGAPATNKVLGGYSKGIGQMATSAHDLADDTIAYGGKVADRQARDYTHIGMKSVRRGDNLALRESKRYTDYALDTYDDAAEQAGRSSSRWQEFGSKSAVRAMNSTRKVYQKSMTAYGDAVHRTYFGFWNIFTPPEPKPWMVGSLNDRIKSTKVPGGVWTKDFAPETEYVVVEDHGKNPVYVQPATR